MCKNSISNKNAFCIYWHRTCVCLKVEHKKIASFYNWFMPLDKSAFVSDHCVNIFKLVYFKRCNFQINDISFEPTCIIGSQCYKMFNLQGILSVVSNLEPLDTCSFLLGKVCICACSKFENAIFVCLCSFEVWIRILYLEILGNSRQTFIQWKMSISIKST